jgi:hypothetical protein
MKINKTFFKNILIFVVSAVPDKKAKASIFRKTQSQTMQKAFGAIFAPKAFTTTMNFVIHLSSATAD